MHVTTIALGKFTVVAKGRARTERSYFSAAREMDLTTVKLLFPEDQVLEVDIQLAKFSALLRTMLEDIGAEAATIPIMEVSIETFKLMLEFIEHHRNDPEVESRPEKRDPDLDPWDKAFLERFDRDVVFDLILAANQYDIPKLQTAGCKYVGMTIKGKTPEQLRAIFDLPNDFSPEEQAQVNEENKWYEVPVAPN